MGNEYQKSLCRTLIVAVGEGESVAGILIVNVWTVALYACVTLLSLFAMLLIK